jgi:hypothetical protein
MKAYSHMEIELMFYPELAAGDEVLVKDIDEYGRVLHFSASKQKYAVELEACTRLVIYRDRNELQLR